MDPTNEAALPGGAPTDIVQVPPPAGEAISTRDAARSLASFRLKQRAGESAPGDGHPADPSADAAAMPDPSAQAQAQADAAPAGSDPGATGETTASSEPPAEPALPAEQAPIEPPRSWTKEARERFASLPRETQEYLAQREQERDRELRRTQNEAAEQRKGLEAERQKAEQVRTQYEAALPDMLGTLQREQASAFPDVKSVVDVEQLAREDSRAMSRGCGRSASPPSRRWRARGCGRSRTARSGSRNIPSASSAWCPRAGSPIRASARFEQAAVGVLRDLGYSDHEARRASHGPTDLSLR